MKQMLEHKYEQEPRIPTRLTASNLKTYLEQTLLYQFGSEANVVVLEDFGKDSVKEINKLRGLRIQKVRTTPIFESEFITRKLTLSCGTLVSLDELNGTDEGIYKRIDYAQNGMTVKSLTIEFRRLGENHFRPYATVLT